MQAIDRLKTALDAWMAHEAGRRDTDGLRRDFARAVPGLTDETLAAVFDAFRERLADPARTGRAAEWLGGVGSLFAMDYDGTPFTADEWAELRDLASVDAGNVDMDVLGYVLGQVLEHGAL